LDIWNRLRTR